MERKPVTVYCELSPGIREVRDRQESSVVEADLVLRVRQRQIAPCANRFEERMLYRRLGPSSILRSRASLGFKPRARLFERGTRNSLARHTR